MAGMLETQAGDRSYDTGIPNIHVGQISFQCAGMTIQMNTSNEVLLNSIPNVASLVRSTSFHSRASNVDPASA
jgi:hypothetical protein